LDGKGRENPEIFKENIGEFGNSGIREFENVDNNRKVTGFGAENENSLLLDAKS